MRYSLFQSSHSLHVLLVVELLYKFVHASNHLLVAELCILFQVVVPLFKLGLCVLFYKGLHCEGQTVEDFGDVAFLAQRQDLFLEETLRAAVHLVRFLELGVFLKGTEFEFVGLPEGEAAFYRIFDVDLLVREELDLVDEPLNRNDTLDALEVGDQLRIL